MGIEGVTRGYRGLQGVIRGYKRLQGVTGGDKGLQRLRTLKDTFSWSILQKNQS